MKRILSSQPVIIIVFPVKLTSLYQRDHFSLRYSRSDTRATRPPPAASDSHFTSDNSWRFGIPFQLEICISTESFWTLKHLFSKFMQIYNVKLHFLNWIHKNVCISSYINVENLFILYHFNKFQINIFEMLFELNTFR